MDTSLLYQRTRNLPPRAASSNEPGWQRTRHAIERYIHPDPPEDDGGLPTSLADLQWYKFAATGGEPWENVRFQLSVSLFVYGWTAAYHATVPPVDGRWPDGAGLNEVWDCRVQVSVVLQRFPPSGPGAQISAGGLMTIYDGHEIGTREAGAEDAITVTVTPGPFYEEH